VQARSHLRRKYEYLSSRNRIVTAEDFITQVASKSSLSGVKVISGGEQGRMLFGKLMLQNPNIMMMDEPTNHLDMESIESLNLALENYPGTLFFVSHDREFISSLATRIIEITADGVNDFKGSYDEYLASQGIVDNMPLRAAG
jgi:ATPase subunit of ABC transporter with duplicated ATPase domains